MAPTVPSSNRPTRIAVIDLGTNSTRLLIADVDSGQVNVVERRTNVTRLGRGVDHSGSLSSEAIEAVCETVAGYVAIIDEAGADATSVIATSAVRDAGNGQAFIAELRERFNLSAELFDGDLEAQTTYLGASFDRAGDEILLVADIGGGSTEVIVGRGTEALFHRSLQAGVVRHTERLLTSDPPSTSDLENLAGDIHRLITGALDDRQLPPIDRCLAVAGTPASLAAIDLALDPYDAGAVEGYVLTLETIQRWLSRLASMALAERKHVVGLHPDRAEAIIAGMVILIEIMRAFDLSEVEVSEHDILYGEAIRAAA